MDFTIALVNALRAEAGPEVKAVAQTSATRVVITHVSGAQIAVDSLALGPHVNGDPARLVAEARGALAALNRIAAQAQEPRDTKEAAERIVPVLRPKAWLTAANTQAGRDLTADGLAFAFGPALIVTYALEYSDQRLPVLSPSDTGGLKPKDLLTMALANQRRIAEGGAEDLIATDLRMGDGTFFLQSKNLQAASLILQPFVWRLTERFVSPPPDVVLGTVVGANAIAFGPAKRESIDEYADMLRSVRTGLRKSFSGDGDWGDDVFVFPRAAQLPQRLV
jgi:hypothetical protein